MPVSTQTRFRRILHRRPQHFCVEMLCRLHKRYDAVISVRAERWCITQKVRYDFFAAVTCVCDPFSKLAFQLTKGSFCLAV